MCRNAAIKVIRFMRFFFVFHSIAGKCEALGVGVGECERFEWFVFCWKNLWTKFKVFATIIKDEKRQFVFEIHTESTNEINERSKQGLFFNKKWACQYNDDAGALGGSVCSESERENGLFRRSQTPFQNAISIIVLVFCIMYTWFLVRLDKQTRALTHAHALKWWRWNFRLTHLMRSLSILAIQWQSRFNVFSVCISIFNFCHCAHRESKSAHTSYYISQTFMTATEWIYYMLMVYTHFIRWWW